MMPRPKVELDEVTHTYRVDGVVYPSVGQLIAKLKKPFKQVEIAAKVARREGREIEDVLEDWLEKLESACLRGHQLHEDIAALLVGKPPPHECALECAQAFIDWWGKSKDVMDFILVEHILFDIPWKIAGTTDAVLFSRKTGRHHVMDWKQNGTFRTENRWEKLLPPFQDLEASHLAIYSIQVWAYTLIMERCTALTFGDPWVMHLGKIATPHRALPLRERVQEWLQTTRKN